MSVVPSATVEEMIEDAIDRWHKFPEVLTLAQYLGMSDSEYRTFLEKGEVPSASCCKTAMGYLSWFRDN